MRFSKKQLFASLCRDSFVDFVKEFWHTVVSEKLSWNWHMDLLCNELQAVAERIFLGLPKLYDLVINVPPGTSKSTIASIMFPAWCWTRMPSFRHIGASYSYDLAMDHSRKNRDVVKSDLYQDTFPEVKLRPDQDTKGYFVTSQGGQRFTTGSCGTVQGMHGHCISIDDPLDPNKAVSEVEMYAVNSWIKETLTGRKVDRRVTAMILIMQRLHQEDPTELFLKRKRVRHISLPAEIVSESTVSPPEIVKYYVDGLLDPNRLPREVLEETEHEFGPYGYCTPGFTPILMSNFRERMIEDVEVGDEVIGFAPGGSEHCDKKRQRGHLIQSKVIAKSTRVADVVCLTTESNRKVYCTPDHKWWTGRGFNDLTHKQYNEAKVGRSLMSVYSPFEEPSDNEQRLFDWLGGMIDGEGACRHGQLQITQSPVVNGEICDYLESVLERLEIPYTRYTQDYAYPGRNQNTRYCYNILGGRSTKIRILNSAKLVKSGQLINGILRKGGKIVEQEDRVVRIEPVGKMRVYGLKTVTGNYVAWGFASKNCSQFLQNPVPQQGGMFDVKKLNYGMPRRLVKVVRYWDKAATASVSKKGRGAFTVGLKMGLDIDGRIFILDVIRVRLDSFNRENLIKNTAVNDSYGVVVGLEQEPGSGGKESAMNTVQRLLGFRVSIDRPQGDKEARADPFSTQVNGGNVWLVPGEWNEDYVKEMKFFPYSTTKDQIDASSGAFNMISGGRKRCGAIRSRKALTGEN